MATGGLEGIESEYQPRHTKKPSGLTSATWCSLPAPGERKKLRASRKKAFTTRRRDTLKIALRKQKTVSGPEDFAGGEGLAVFVLSVTRK